MHPLTGECFDVCGQYCVPELAARNVGGQQRQPRDVEVFHARQMSLESGDGDGNTSFKLKTAKNECRCNAGWGGEGHTA